MQKGSVQRVAVSPHPWRGTGSVPGAKSAQDVKSTVCMAQCIWLYFCEGVVPCPTENGLGLRPGAGYRAPSYGKFHSTCKSLTWDFCSGSWGM